MRLHRVEQGSQAWYRLRLGKPTASNFDKIVTPSGQPSKQADDYLYRLVCEQILNESMDDEIGYVQWVARGKENEPNAVASYQFANDVELEPGGFMTTDDGWVGASPDRLYPGHKEAVEIKCPAPWTLLKYHFEGLEKAYIAQLQGQILVGELKCVHFYAWHPNMPPFEHTVLPDTAYLSVLRAGLQTFVSQLIRHVERARALGEWAPVRRVETPGEVAYQRDEDQQLRDT